MKNTLRYWREKRRLTQGELAELVGLRTQTIGNIETGKSDPRARTQRNLAEVLKVPVDELFEIDEHPSLLQTA